jgi:8-hydroxy-5-deazaflavin:NADPH oxidoreductase
MTAIAVLGAGNIGATLARKWTAAGHRVTLASRNPDAPALRDLAASIGAQTASHHDAVRDAAVVLVALPGDAVAAVAAVLGGALDGKVVIDASNNVAAAEFNSIAAVIRYAPDAVCARAFNSLGWENFAEPDFDGTQADLLWCGPDGDPGGLVERLIADVGLRPVRVGGLDQLPRRRHARPPLVRARSRPRPAPRLQGPHPLTHPRPPAPRSTNPDRASTPHQQPTAGVADAQCPVATALSSYRPVSPPSSSRARHQ